MTQEAAAPLKFSTLERWYESVAESLQAAAQAEKGKAWGLYEALMQAGRIAGLTQKTFVNNLTPPKLDRHGALSEPESHRLSLRDAWHIMDVTGNHATPALQAVFRHRQVLVTEPESDFTVGPSRLFALFSQHKSEVAETQAKVKEALLARAPIPPGLAEEIKREVYEDFCAEIEILSHLELLSPNCPRQPQEQASHTIRLHGLFQEIVDCCREGSLSLSQSGEEEILAKEIKRLSQADLNQNMPRLSLYRFMQLLESDANHQLLEALARSLGRRIYPLGPPADEWSSDGDIFDVYAELERHQAGTVEKVKEALEDGQVSPEELSAIRRDMALECEVELGLIRKAQVF